MLRISFRFFYFLFSLIGSLSRPTLRFYFYLCSDFRLPFFFISQLPLFECLSFCYLRAGGKLKISSILFRLTIVFVAFDNCIFYV